MSHPTEKHDSSSPEQGDQPAFSCLAEGDFHARLGAAPHVSMVLFSAPHCGACRTWKRLLPLALSDLGSNFFEVDVSVATGIARCFDIFHLPTVYLYRDGRFHGELQCVAHPDAIRHAVQALLAAPPQEEP